MSVQGSPKLSRYSICEWLNENESQIVSASLSFALFPSSCFLSKQIYSWSLPYQTQERLLLHSA